MKNLILLFVLFNLIGCKPEISDPGGMNLTQVEIAKIQQRGLTERTKIITEGNIKAVQITQTAQTQRSIAKTEAFEDVGPIMLAISCVGGVVVFFLWSNKQVQHHKIHSESSLQAIRIQGDTFVAALTQIPIEDRTSIVEQYANKPPTLISNPTPPSSPDLTIKRLGHG